MPTITDIPLFLLSFPNPGKTMQSDRPVISYEEGKKICYEMSRATYAIGRIFGQVEATPEEFEHELEKSFLMTDTLVGLTGGEGKGYGRTEEEKMWFNEVIGRFAINLQIPVSDKAIEAEKSMEASDLFCTVDDLPRLYREGLAELRASDPSIFNPFSQPTDMSTKAPAPTAATAATTAGSTLAPKPEEVKVLNAEITYHDGPLLIPHGWSLDMVMQFVAEKKAYFTSEVEIYDTFTCFPWDGALALKAVLEKRYGWANQVREGWNPPAMIRVQIGVNESVDVPWGAFSVPGLQGKVSMDCARGASGRLDFKLIANVLRKDEHIIREIFNEVREQITGHSIYRGKALKVTFRNPNGTPIPLPQPEFMDLSSINPDNLIYSRPVQSAIEINLFTPIRRHRDMEANGMNPKRGVLLGGVYGTGKTMAALVAAHYAEEAGLTYLYIPKANELGDAIEFGMQNSADGCVVFCEDIDRALSGPRNAAIDGILNLVDGIDTKGKKLILVLTTNDLEGIEPAMLRPGRLDAIIEVTPPDADAAQRLLRAYTGDALDPEADLTEAGEALSGKIPAAIAEVAQRAKLAALADIKEGELVTKISAKNLTDAAVSMSFQDELLAKRMKKDDPTPTLDQAVRGAIYDEVQNAMNDR